eukprot:3505835-Prymnesium_polylepis.1
MGGRVCGQRPGAAWCQQGAVAARGTQRRTQVSRSVDRQVARYGLRAQLHKHPADGHVFDLGAGDVLEVHARAQPYRRRHGIGRRVVLKGAVSRVDQRQREV